MLNNSLQKSSSEAVKNPKLSVIAGTFSGTEAIYKLQAAWHLRIHQKQSYKRV